MIDKLQEKLKNDTELGFTPSQIDYITKELDKINVWFEVARNEVITAIEDIYNDELYDYEEELTNITEETINEIAWKVEDYDVWKDVYEFAREEILEMLESERE